MMADELYVYDFGYIVKQRLIIWETTTNCDIRNRMDITKMKVGSPMADRNRFQDYLFP